MQLLGDLWRSLPIPSGSADVFNPTKREAEIAPFFKGDDEGEGCHNRKPAPPFLGQENHRDRRELPTHNDVGRVSTLRKLLTDPASQAQTASNETQDVTQSQRHETQRMLINAAQFRARFYSFFKERAL
jgi:hypothetical protein